MPRPPLDWSGALPPGLPAGFSRESRIRIDREGRLFHEGHLVEHTGLARGMMSWLTRHPGDGRWVLENGWDWCYLAVDDVPWVAGSARVVGDDLVVSLADGSEEPIAALVVDADGVLRGAVKAAARGGPHPCKLSRTAQLSLIDHLVEGPDGVVLVLGARNISL